VTTPRCEHLRTIARRYGLAILGAISLQGLLVAVYRTRSPVQSAPHVFHAAPLGGTERAPAVSFLGLDGTAVPLASFRGHVVLVHFWATWCPPCRRELPALLDLAQRQHEGLVLLLVAVRDDPAVLQRFFLGSIPSAVRLDPTGERARQFGAATFPDSFLVSREGFLTHRLRGPQNWRGRDAQHLLTEALRPGR